MDQITPSLLIFLKLLLRLASLLNKDANSLISLRNTLPILGASCTSSPDLLQHGAVHLAPLVKWYVSVHFQVLVVEDVLLGSLSLLKVARSKCLDLDVCLLQLHIVNSALIHQRPEALILLLQQIPERLHAILLDVFGQFGCRLCLGPAVGLEAIHFFGE